MEGSIGSAPPLPPPLSFEAALASLQSAAHRHTRERLAWAAERQGLEAQVAALAQEKRQLVGLHELLVGRVRMLEYALQQERRSRRDDARAGGHEETAAVVAALPPATALARPPAVAAAEGRVRASQAIIMEYLGIVERAEAAAAARPVVAAEVPTAAPQALRTTPAAIVAAAVPTPTPPSLGLLAPAGQTPTANAPPPFFSLPPTPPPATSSPPSRDMGGAAPLGADSRSSAAADTSTAVEAALVPAPAAPRATLSVLAAKPAAAPTAVGPDHEFADAVESAPAAPAAAPGRRRVSVTGGRVRLGGTDDAARGALRMRQAAGSQQALPVSWQQSAALRSHVDVVRSCTWLPAPPSGSTAAAVPQLLTCSDDGTAKVWAVAAPVGAARRGGGSSAATGASSRTLPSDDCDLTEPLRTFRCGRTAVVRGIALSCVDLGGGNGGSDAGGSQPASALVRACVAAAAAEAGLPATSIAQLTESTRKDAVGVLACADGSLCVVLLPALSPPAAGVPAGALPPSTYDLPSAASLPCVRVAGAHADCVWALAQAPPGYAVGALSAASAAASETAGPDDLATLPADADTRSVPVFLSAGADGFLRLWRLGVRAADGRPGVAALATLSVGALMCRPPSPAAVQGEPDQTQAAPDISAAAVSAAAFDLVSPAGLAAWVAVRGGGSDSIAKVDLTVPGGRVILRARVRSIAAASSDSAPLAVTAIVPHPQLPLVFAATTHVACGVTVIDALSGALVHCFAAHSTGVASLAIDPTGAALASCGADGDVRVWSVESRACLWSVRAHRSKQGEMALGVAFHPSASALLATAGADSLAKVFSPQATSVSAGGVGAPKAVEDAAGTGVAGRETADEPDI